MKCSMLTLMKAPSEPSFDLCVKRKEKRALITKPNAFNKNGQVRKQKQTEANQNKKTKEKYKT